MPRRLPAAQMPEPQRQRSWWQTQIEISRVYREIIKSRETGTSPTKGTPDRDDSGGDE
jgi:hypothetical protein